jgi:hypothetical protein
MIHDHRSDTQTQVRIELKTVRTRRSARERSVLMCFGVFIYYFTGEVFRIEFLLC